MTIPFYTRIEPELLKQLTDEAEIRRLGKSDIVNEALRIGLARMIINRNANNAQVRVLDKK